MQTHEPTQPHTSKDFFVREQLLQEIERTPDEVLKEVLDFLLFIKARSSQKESTAKSLLKYAGTWQGDDLEDCLQLVHQTRGQFYIADEEASSQ